MYQKEVKSIREFMQSTPIPVKQQAFNFVVFAFVAAIVLSPLAYNNVMPVIFDILNHLAIIVQSKLALTQGQFPLRIAPLEQSGWLYPYFQFYSSTSYTIAGIIYKGLDLSNPFVAYKLTLWFALIFGAFYMNKLIFWLTSSRPIAMLSSVAFLLSPYYIILINYYGAFNEAIALSIIPATLFYTLQRYDHPNENTALLSSSLMWYLLATTHLSTFFYTSLFVAMLLLLLTLKTSNWKNLLSATISYFFGCALAAWFLTPCALLGKYLEIAKSITSMKTTGQLPLLLAPTINYFGVQNDPQIGITPSVGLLMILAISICIYAMINHYKSGAKRIDTMLFALLFLFFMAFMMVWSPVNFWRWLPLTFSVGQYSWRVMSQITWISPLLFAWALYWLFENNLNKKHIMIGILLLLILSSAWLPMHKKNYVPFKDLIQPPTLIFNPDAYLINHNQHYQFIDNIDNLTFDTALINNNLKSNKPFLINSNLLTFIPQPNLSITGNSHNKNNNEQLIITMNNKPIEKFAIKPGQFHLDIPLTNLKNTSGIALQFKATEKNHSLQNIEITNLVLNGFYKAENILTVKQIEPYCKQQNDFIFCELTVPLKTKIMELPALYYPNMLDIKLNGNAIPYESLLSNNRLMVGITPIAGMLNTIQIQFRGLLWANTISEVAWGLWVLFFLYLWAKRRRTQV